MFSRLPVPLAKQVEKWTLTELDTLISLLERDNSLTDEEIAECVSTKSVENVAKLCQACVNASEKDIIGEENDVPESLPEESNSDVISKSLRAFIPKKFSTSLGISSVFRDLSDDSVENIFETNWVPRQKEDKPPNYSKMYRFISDLFINGKTPEPLNKIDSAAVVDMSICLLTMVDRLLIDIPQNNSPDNLSVVINIVSKRVGNALSLIASFRRMFKRELGFNENYNFAGKKNAELTLKNPRVISPLAPVCVRNAALSSTENSKIKRIASELLQRQEREWKFPFVVKDEEPEDTDGLHVCRRISDFTFNPLNIPVDNITSINELFGSLQLLESHYTHAIQRLLLINKPVLIQSNSRDLLSVSGAKATDLVRIVKPKKYVKRIQRLKLYRPLDDTIRYNQIDLMFCEAVVEKKNAVTVRKKKR